MAPFTNRQVAEAYCDIYTVPGAADRYMLMLAEQRRRKGIEEHERIVVMKYASEEGDADEAGSPGG